MQKAEGVADVAFSGGIGADEHGERTKLSVASLKFLKCFKCSDLITCPSPPGLQWPSDSAPVFICHRIAKAGKGDRPSRRHSACLEVIAQVFEDDHFVPLLVTPGEFDQGLKEVEEEGVLP